MKVKDYFKKRYLGYELIIVGSLHDEDDEGYYWLLDFYIENNKLHM